MKRYFPLLLVSCVVFLFSACSKSDKASLSDDIKNFVPDSIISIAEAHGMVINKGLTPPTIEGIYLATPLTTVSDNSNLYAPGHVIQDNKYRFYDQDNDALTIKYEYKGTSESGVGNGAFLAGAGSKFTSFIETHGILSGINFVNITMISGEITSDGIKNFYYCLYVKSKDADPTHKVAEIGTVRVFKDVLAETQSTY